MEKPSWVINDIKYQRALAEAKDPTNEKEVKELYISFGGLISEPVVEQQVDSPSAPSAWVAPEEIEPIPVVPPTEPVEPTVEPEPVVEPVEEVAPEELPVVGEVVE